MSNEIPIVSKPSKGSSFRLRRILQKWPLLIWMGALFGVVYMFAQRGSFGRVNGMVFANLEDIAPPEDGKILTVHVRDGDEVTKGQTLVTLDTELLRREIERREQDLILERLKRFSDFQSNLTSIEDSLNKVRADELQDKTNLAAAEKNVLAVQGEVDAGRLLPPDLAAAKLARDKISGRLTTYEERLTALAKSRTAALKLIDDLKIAEGAEADGEEPKALRELKQRLENKTLVAPADGIVQKVHKLRGVVKLGEPVLTFIPHRDNGDMPAKMVRGFVKQGESPEDLGVGNMVWISVRAKNPVAYQAKVVSVAPAITAIQNYGTSIAGQFLRGREFLCELPKDLDHLLPGTAVQIYRSEPGKFDIWSFGKTPVKAASN